MCGIVGVAGSLAARPGDEVASIVGRASDALRHRGPDGGGFWAPADDTPVAFGHRRLSIIDLSEAANQPMLLPGGRQAITYNGELYNYLELRDELTAEGCTFSTASDTEVLLVACTHWGVPTTLRRANGMFAFGYADLDRNRLWLARDRFGEKPLYWAIWDGTLAFASELKALRAIDGFPAEVDRDALAEYFRWQAFRPPATVYQAARQLRPGCALVVPIGDRIEHSDVREVVWWDAVAEALDARETPFTGTMREATSELDELLGAGVRSRMISDVPLGAFLSGGIDSSTVVAMMCTRGTGPVRTFTIGFREQAMNEAEDARKVAAHFGTDHTEFVVTAADAFEVIPKLATMYDEPFGDSSQIPTHLVSALARRHVTVSLSGDGGDELFGGYDRYALAGRTWSRLSRLPAPMRRLAGRGISAVSPERWNRLARLTRASRFVGGNVGDRAQKLAGLLGRDGASEMYDRMMAHWDEPIVLGTSVPRGSLVDGLSLTEQLMLRDTVTYMPDDILTKVDRAAMAASLETRVPVLDPDVYRFAWTLPMELKRSRGKGKLVLREVLRHYLPEHLWDRPKMGFGIPLGTWLRTDLREWAGGLLDPARIRAEGYLDADLVATRWREHLSGERNWQYPLWSVLMFQAWLDEWSPS
jgi:asparagine synthase (glutamine-hydrolysing)